MKTAVRFCLFVVFSLFFSKLIAQTENIQEKTTVQWEPDTLFFENMNEGDILLDSFKVTNTGEHPYLVRSVKTTCDCTLFRVPKKPLMPGETATIRVEFDSAGKSGVAQPGIIVYDNSSPNLRSIIYLSGYIIPRTKPKNPLGGG
jgi:hypothetical protein